MSLLGLAPSLPPQAAAPQPCLPQPDSTLRYAVQGITCAACALEIEWLLTRCASVASVQVDAGDALVKLRLNGPDPGLERLNELLRPGGYTLVPSHDPQAQDQVEQMHRQAWWRLALAMLCMMQVMMYAAPLYWMSAGEIDADMEALLRKAGWVLSLPVVLICARPYWVRAWSALRARRLPMDVSVALGIAVAFVAGTVEAFRSPGLAQGARDIHLDSLTMFVAFILIAQALEQSMRKRTARRLDRLLGRLPQKVQRRNALGELESVDAQALAVGDLIMVRPGEQVPADAQIEGSDGEFSEAMLTGESGIVRRAQGEMALAGTICASRPVLLRVRKLGQSTRLGRIQTLMRRCALTGTSYTEATERIAPAFLLVVLGCAALTAVWWSLHDASRMASAVAAVLVVSCPCAVVLAAPSARLRAARIAAEHGVVTQKGDAFARLVEAKTMVFDKTGTLSLDESEMKGMDCASGESPERLLAVAGAIAMYSNHPKSRSLVSYCEQHGLTVPQFPVHKVREVPGQGVLVALDGQQARALGFACDNDRGITLALGGPRLVQQPGGSVHTDVLLGIADGGMDPSPGEKARWLAGWSMQERSREGAAAVVSQLKAQGLRVTLLSGDHWQAAHRFAQALGIDEVKAQCSPEDKLQHIAHLQASGPVVMVGDGINDAACLAKANASIALGSASALAQSQCDFIITTERLDAIGWLQGLAHKAKSIEVSNLRWAIAYNVVMIPAAASGSLPVWLSGLGMATSSLFVMLNSMRIRADKT